METDNQATIRQELSEYSVLTNIHRLNIIIFIKQLRINRKLQLQPKPSVTEKREKKMTAISYRGETKRASYVPH